MNTSAARYNWYVLVYAGIDEAGYGPMLGPLCVGLIALECAGERTEVPDLWDVCAHAVCRRPRDAGTIRIAIDDSKALKLPNSCKTRDPLAHLERGVLACLAASHAGIIQSDVALANALSIRTSGLDWYAGSPIELPVSTTREHLSLLASRLNASLNDQQLKFSMIRCACADERVFNTLLAQHGSKASASFCVVARLINELCDQYANTDDATIKLVVDRQGARRSYADTLTRSISPRGLVILEQSDRASVYEIETKHGQTLRILFRSKAESEHFPVALASMTAKLVRELMMRRFNRYWCDRITELRPTAGYVTDARRWLRDTSPHISDLDREVLIRKA